MKKSIAITIILKLLFASVLIAWFLHKNDLHKIVAIVSSFPPVIFLIAVLLMFVLILFNAVKWFLLLPQYSIIKLFEINLIGQYYGLILPGQILGEGAKAYLLGKNKSDKGTVWMSVMLDKVTGIIALFTLGLFGIIFTKQKLPVWLDFTLLLLICMSFLFLFLIRIKFIYSFLTNLLNKLNVHFKKLNRVTSLLFKFMDAWLIYTQKTKILFLSIATGIVGQTLSIIINMILAHAISIEVSFTDWCWIQAVVSIVILLPVTIGGIGLREGSLIGLLGLFSVSAETALALSFALFSLQIIRAIAGGILDYRLTLVRN
ncbi:MAG: lysylphosphatidylglycerol synthase transmembrane domain-containing protein [Bacteroidia bacterium]